MVTEEDCSCTDTTEPSNVTSLQSDNVTITVNSDVNAVYTKTCDKGNETPKETDCKCLPDTSPDADYCVSETMKEVSTKPNCQSQQESSRSQPLPMTTTMTQLRSNFPCLCHSHKIMQSRQFWSRFSWKRPRNGYFGKQDKIYEIKLKHSQCPHYAKMANGTHKQYLDAFREFQPFLNKISEIPSKNKRSHDPPGKSKPLKYQAKKKSKKEAAEKIEIYYLDHGNSTYYRTTDCHPLLTTDKCAEKTDQAAIRFWAEIFGTIHIGIAFVTAFILQLFRFVLYSVIRPLTIGILQLTADYFAKPLLSIIFNALIQPVLILFYNIAISLKDLCTPIAETMGLFLREIAHLCAAIRFMEVKHIHTPTTTCT